MSDTAIVFRGEGLDAFWNTLTDSRARSIQINGGDYFSLVDLMRYWGKNTSNPRRYWSDHKRELLDDDPELYEKIVQFKILADDGKMRATDLAPRWICLYIVLGMNTPQARAFRKHVAKWLDGMTKTQIKYRSVNVDRGMEWAADTIHEEIKHLPAPERLSAYEEMGYIR